MAASETGSPIPFGTYTVRDWTAPDLLQALADPNLVGRAGNPQAPGYTTLAGSFTKLGFNQNDLVDGRAIMAHDSVTTVGSALGQISAVGSTAAPVPVTGTLIQSQILNELRATARSGARARTA